MRVVLPANRRAHGCKMPKNYKLFVIELESDWFLSPSEGDQLRSFITGTRKWKKIVSVTDF